LGVFSLTEMDVLVLVVEVPGEAYVKEGGELFLLPL
jgi:hypothetical protein